MLLGVVLTTNSLANEMLLHVLMQKQLITQMKSLILSRDLSSSNRLQALKENFSRDKIR